MKRSVVVPGASPRCSLRRPTRFLPPAPLEILGFSESGPKGGPTRAHGTPANDPRPGKREMRRLLDRLTGVTSHTLRFDEDF